MKIARTPRVWFNGPIDLQEPHNTIELPKQTAHHLTTVLRANDGHRLELFNGDGRNYSALLKRSGKKVFAHIQSVTVGSNESPLTTLLVQSVSRGDRMDTSVQKCVELGITQIQPIYTQHSIPVLKADRATRKLEHWKAIAISAAEQSGRSVVPQIHPPLPLVQWLESQWLMEKSNGMVGWVLDPSAEQTLNAASVQQTTEPAGHAILIGPESGLESTEVNSAVASGFNATRFRGRILRTETAGPAVLCSIQALAGDLLL